MFQSSPDPETATQTVESVPEPDHIFARIAAHAAAYKLLDVEPPENDEQLLEYFYREQEEIGAHTELTLWPPRTIAGARALIAYTARCFRLQSWHEETVKAVLKNVLNTVERTPHPITAAEKPDPIFSAIRAHARVTDVMASCGDEDYPEGILDDETAACDEFSLTVPTTFVGTLEKIRYALRSKELYIDGKDGGKAAAIAAMLASLLWSPVLNPSPAKAAA